MMPGTEIADRNARCVVALDHWVKVTRSNLALELRDTLLEILSLIHI